MKKTKQYKIGIDVGGTKMSAVLFDGENIIDDYTLATPKDSLEKFMIMIKALVEPLLAKAKTNKVKVEMIGLGVPGLIDADKCKIIHAPNLEIISGINLAKKLEEFISIPVIMDNDVNCFLRAEMLQGAGRKYKNAYGMTIGTGIGGAWWFQNSIYQGASNSGGEPGAMIIDFSENIKLEPAYHKLTQNNPSSLADEAYRGDILAEKTFEEVGKFLGLALSNIVNLIDPEVIIFGGGVLESSDLFLSRAKKIMKENIISSESRKRIKILKSKLGLRAGAVGAALLE
jgi:glucokinase